MILVQVPAFNLTKGDKVEIMGQTFEVATKCSTSNGQYIALNDCQGFRVKELMVKDLEPFGVVSEAFSVDYSHPQIAHEMEYVFGLEMESDQFVFDALGFGAGEAEYVELLRQAA